MHEKPKPPRGKNPSRSFLLVASSLGLALALVGCTSDSGSRTPGSAPGQATTSGTGGQSPSPTVAGELGYVAGPELEAATSAWATTQEGAIFTSDAALRAQIPAAEKWLKDINVEPKECGLYGIGSLKDQLDEAVMAAVTFPENVGADITVASYEDLNALVADVAAQQHLDESCGKYTISSPQQEVITKLSDLKVATSAPYSAGTLMVTVNGKNTSKQVSVRAIDGHVMVTATRKAANNPDEATARATADVEAILAVLREREAAAGTKP